MDKNSLMKRCHNDLWLQVNMYNFMDVDTEKIAEDYN